MVRILPGAALLEVARHPGPGGLPPGVSGKVVALLSGGIDSPVAAYRLMRRGAEVVLVHFHPFPLLSGASREKARAIAERLECCTLFAPKHPVTQGELSVVLDTEARLPTEELLELSTPPRQKPRRGPQKSPSTAQTWAPLVAKPKYGRLALKDREVALFTWPVRKALEEGAPRAFIMEHGPA